MALQFKTWFVSERAKALATVLLTRRDDLEVRASSKPDSGLDYTVNITSQHRVGPRCFGILIHATTSPVTIEQANEQLQPTMDGLPQDGEILMPLCVFYFTAKDDCGYCTWGDEPVVERGQAKLRRRSKADCRLLDDEALEEIVSDVIAWYDELAASLKASIERGCVK